METRHWQDWITALIGIWLIISPWMLPIVVPEGSSTIMITTNFVVCGVLALALASVALSRFSQWEEFANIVLAVWLIISPSVLGFSGTMMAMINAIFCGAVLFIAAGWTIYDVNRMGRA